MKTLQAAKAVLVLRVVQAARVLLVVQAAKAVRAAWRMALPATTSCRAAET